MTWKLSIFIRRVVMGAVIAGLTALSHGVDPIDWRAVLSAAIAGALAGAGVDTDAFKSGGKHKAAKQAND